ncbi:diacylglycerol/lipid kinase family protein [Paenibacillus faecalis]|uniref:diacylglycerol/lipid kinase family protein n=1 Tax=Paenibacillus faecalis TaxID=2079532 RepID=UPI000D10B5BD|nr:diacylglycerol kinase family protein [Paenibacillus faecalis]
MIFFIVNRRSGNGQGFKVWKRIRLLLRKKGVHYQVKFSESPDHAAQILKKHVKEAAQVKAVAVIGGDGTLQSIVGELAGTRIPLGVIPAGSGNDFARALGIPSSPKKALDYLLTGAIQKIDLAQNGNRTFITVVGIGLDGKLAQNVNQSKYKKWFNRVRMGRLAYIVSFLQVFTRYRPSLSVSIQVDDKEMTFSDVWLIAVANIPNYGGGMNICPHASYTDGFFDICIVHGVSRFEALRLFLRVITGKHTSCSGVSMLKGKKVKVLSSSEMIAHGDGEIIGETPIDISIRQEAIHIICKENRRVS